MPFEYIADSIDERLEKFQSFQDHLPAYISRGQEYDKRNNVVGILHVPDYEAETITRYDIPGKNLIVDTGDTYYAQLGTGETVTNDYAGDANARMVLRNNVGAVTPQKTDTLAQVTTPIFAAANDVQAINATYPRTNDPDGDNPAPGADVATWTYDWAAGEATSDINPIQGGAISVLTTLPPAAPTGTDTLLNHFNFSSSFTKPAGATLKVINNHTFNGIP